MLGFQWGYWDETGGNWTFPPNAGEIYFLPYNSYSEGTCANYRALDATLLNDEEITENVIVSIYDDPYLKRSDKEKIRVRVQNNVVELAGTVSTYRAQVKAYLDAFEAPGVIEVQNHLRLEQKLPQQRY